MTDALPVVNKSVNKGVVLVKQWAPPIAGGLSGYVAGDLLGIGSFAESIIKSYTSITDGKTISRFASIIVIAAYLGIWAMFRGGGMISAFIGWFGVGVVANEFMALKGGL